MGMVTGPMTYEFGQVILTTFTRKDTFLCGEFLVIPFNHIYTNGRLRPFVCLCNRVLLSGHRLIDDKYFRSL